MSRSRPILVLAPIHSQFLRNRAFDHAYMSQFHGGAFFPELGRIAREAGIEVTTADQFQAEGSKDALLVSDMGTAFDLTGARPAICFALEPPVVARRFFHELRTWSRRFPHVFLWSGAASRIDDAVTTFHEIYWPNDGGSLEVRDRPPEDGLLVYVAANKTYGRNLRMFISRRHPIWGIRGLMDELGMARDPWLSDHLMNLRRNAVVELSAHPGFTLRGMGWDAVAPTDTELAAAVARCYGGPIGPGTAPKLETLARHRFTLCLENAAFPGYITEKLFDALRAGSVPVYLGAPNAEDYLPSTAYVDARIFGSFTEMLAALEAMPAHEVEAYRRAGREFLATPAFTEFTARRLAERFVATLVEMRNGGRAPVR